MVKPPLAAVPRQRSCQPNRAAIRRAARSGSLTVRLTCSMRGLAMAGSCGKVWLSLDPQANLRSSPEEAMAQSPLLSIGELSRRTGLSVSAIRFYEARGLVTAVRSAGNQRRFLRADIRRLSFALIAQQLGLSLAEIEAELAILPQGRAPTPHDWRAISRRIRGSLQARLDLLERTRERLDGCIGCGCLALAKCKLYKPGDRAARAGAGPRFLLGDRPQDFEGREPNGRASAGTPPRLIDPTQHP